MKNMLTENNMLLVMREADAGDLDAMHRFINLCAFNDDDSHSLLADEKCLEYMKKLAEAGRPEAYVQLADMFLHGTGVNKNVEMAMDLCQKAADAGEITAYGFMGLVYYDGEELPQDYKKAYDLLIKAGERSNEILYKLGEMYRLGLYVDQDTDKARECYQKVVDMGEFMPGSGLDTYFHCAEERLKVEKILHKAEIQADRNGTKAAAVTGVKGI